MKSIFGLWRVHTHSDCFCMSKRFQDDSFDRIIWSRLPAVIVTFFFEPDCCQFVLFRRDLQNLRIQIMHIQRTK